MEEQSCLFGMVLGECSILMEEHIPIYIDTYLIRLPAAIYDTKAWWEFDQTFSSRVRGLWEYSPGKHRYKIRRLHPPWRDCDWQPLYIEGLHGALHDVIQEKFYLGLVFSSTCSPVASRKGRGWWLCVNQKWEKTCVTVWLQDDHQV